MTVSKVRWQDGDDAATEFLLLDALPFPAWYANSRGIRERFNPAWRRVTGLEDGDRWQNAIHAEDIAGCLAATARAVASGGAGHCEYRLRTADGHFQRVHEAISPLDGAKDGPGGFIGVLTTQSSAAEVVAEYSTLGQFLVDREGRCTFMNAAAETLFGFPRDQVEGRILHDVIHSRRPDGTRFPISECTLEGATGMTQAVSEVAALFLRAGGRFFPAECSATPVFEGSTPAGLVLEVRDATWERQAAATVASEHARVQLLADASAPIGNTQTLQGSLEQLARVAVPSFADLCIVDLLQGDRIERTLVVIDPARGVDEAARAFREAAPDAANPDDPVTRVIHTGEPYFVERFDRNSIGQLSRNPEHRASMEKLGMVSGVTLPLAARGRVFGAVSLGAASGRAPYTHDDLNTLVEFGRRMSEWIDTIQLIAELKATNDSLHRAQDRLQLLADSGQRLTASEDDQEALEATATLAVPSFADLCIIDLVRGGSLERAVVTAAPTVPPELVEAIRNAPPETDEPVANVARTGDPAFYPHLAPAVPGAVGDPASGKFGTASTISIPLTSGRTTYGVVSFHLGRGSRRYTVADFELANELGRRLASWLEKVRLIEDLQRANEAKDEFMGMISHEMRTPMTVINGGARVLARRGLLISDQERSDLTNDMERESERLLGMVDNLLTLARVELAEEPENEPVIVQRVVQHVIDRQRERGSTREIRVHLEHALPLVGAHASNLEQVLRNLVVNAEKYSPPGSPIDIDCRSDGPEAVVVRVADQGTGVDPAELELIFQRFYRSARTSNSVGGSGLGLALCKRLVEAMGGTIWAEGREGGGLEVAFRLPAFEPDLLD